MSRPKEILKWAVSNFGPVAANRDERAARVAEEAIEIAHAEGVSVDALWRIVGRVYSRPIGHIAQEIGGLGVTLEALAENVGLSTEIETEREFQRIIGLPKEWWEQRHAEKVAAGTADLSEPKISWEICPEDHDKLKLYGDPCKSCGIIQGSDMK